MENSRPTHNINLPLKSGGSVNEAGFVKGTIKTPTLKLKRKVQEQTVRSIALSEECLEAFKQTKPLAEQMAGAMTADPAKYAELRKQHQEVLDRINQINEEQFDIMAEQLKLIVNVPNDAGEVDWEEIPEADMNEAIGFFAPGPKS